MVYLVTVCTDQNNFFNFFLSLLVRIPLRIVGSIKDTWFNLGKCRLSNFH